MKKVETETFWVKIYISGPLEVIKQVCRQECMSGLCVTVDPTLFIYTGGEEAGAVVGLINYPRFPVDPDTLFARAEELAGKLLEVTFQHSVLVMSPLRTVWKTKREGV